MISEARPKFLRIVKKLPLRLKTQLDSIIREIEIDPKIGELKHGDINFIWIYAFKDENKQIWLLSYIIKSEKKIEFIYLATHENYYRDLKKYLKN
ncbi:hypothetical protein GM51_16700 [freshwater metagenome]|jgi:hypothetical protein|uniref:Addiction module toxin RelE n=1 Tax=freshwater metagenome TaxID=449393 RepID=A0A094S9J6_9ZZZZ